jgi:cytochrome P450
MTSVLSSNRSEGAEVASRSGLYYSQRLKCWVVEGYAEANAVMRESALEIPRLPLPSGMLDNTEQAALMPLWEQSGHVPLYSSGSEHRRLRRELRGAFTTKAVTGWRSLIRGYAAALVDARMPSGQLEVMEDVGRPLLRHVMAEVLGIPTAMRDDFHRWAHAAMDIGKLGTPEWSGTVLDDACRASDALVRMAEELLARPSDLPSGTVAGIAIARQDAPGSLSAKELATNLRSLYTAGMQTTIHLVGSAAYLSFADASALVAVRADPEGAADVVRETLRFACPAAETIIRRATRDVTIGAHRIRRGEFVRTVILRASRDPAQFHDPDVFDHHRPHAGKVLAFGTGPHVCLGNHLATAVAEETCAVLATPRYAARLAMPHPRFVRRPAIPVMWGPEWVRLELGPSTEGAGG